MGDMDDASFALIQQMMQEENPYSYDDYYGGRDQDSGDDSDYGAPKKRKKKQATKGERGDGWARGGAAHAGWA